MIAVWGATASDTWTIASDSTMYRWNGATWGSMTLPAATPLFAITGTRESEVWMSTGSGTVVDGGTSMPPTNSGGLFHWTPAQSPPWKSYPVPLGGATSSWTNALWSNASNASNDV